MANQVLCSQIDWKMSWSERERWWLREDFKFFFKIIELFYFLWVFYTLLLCHSSHEKFLSENVNFLPKQSTTFWIFKNNIWNPPWVNGGWLLTCLTITVSTSDGHTITHFINNIHCINDSDFAGNCIIIPFAWFAGKCMVHDSWFMIHAWHEQG